MWGITKYVVQLKGQVKIKDNLIVAVCAASLIIFHIQIGLTSK